MSLFNLKNIGELMLLYPTFYFRSLSQPITLSHVFNITLRNLSSDELPIFQKSIQTLSNKLSDKERRRILYTLYPLGNFSLEGTLEEQFIREISKIWVIATCDKKLPFEQGLVDYGFLCGYISDNNYLRNPGGFICDINTLSSREILRALKKELPKAAQLILNPNLSIDDIKDIVVQASYWDGILTQHNNIPYYVQLAKSLRLTNEYTDLTQKFIQYCISAEILLVHNPSKNDSKMPMNRQFVSKLTLIRHMMIKLKKQHSLYSLDELQHTFNQIYDFRSQLIHGRQYTPIDKKTIARYINLLHPTIRLGIELQTTDPLFIEFIKRI